MDKANDRHESAFDGEDTKNWFPKQAKKEEEEQKPQFRKFLYHKKCPQGQIFTDEERYNAAILEGGVKAPWLINEDTEKLRKQAKEKEENEKREAELKEAFEEKKLQEEFEGREKQREEAEIAHLQQQQEAQDKLDKKDKKDKKK